MALLYAPVMNKHINPFQTPPNHRRKRTPSEGSKRTRKFSENVKSTTSKDSLKQEEFRRRSKSHSESQMRNTKLRQKAAEEAKTTRRPYQSECSPSPPRGGSPFTTHTVSDQAIPEDEEGFRPRGFSDSGNRKTSDIRRAMIEKRMKEKDRNSNEVTENNKVRKRSLSVDCLSDKERKELKEHRKEGRMSKLKKQFLKLTIGHNHDNNDKHSR